MSRFGFRLLSGGVGPANITNSYIAFSPSNDCDETPRLFQWLNVFNYSSSLLLGYSMSAVDGGQFLPSTDTSGRHLPAIWVNKKLRLEVSGSHFPLVSTRTEVKLTLSNYDAHSREITVYEDTFNMDVRGTNVGGINVEGRLEAVNLDSWNNSDVYASIMHPFDW
ncbi:MAG TPA: hypothetical protein ENJ33_01095 [Thiothrix sp.]|nr:hypothetical protein [Thiothrix sp.]